MVKKRPFQDGVISALAFSLLLTGCSKPEPGTNIAPATTPPAAATRHGTLTVEALINKGTSFGFYFNDLPGRATLPVVPAAWSTYQFEVGATLTSFRLDFSDVPDVIMSVRKIRISLPGDKPRDYNLEEMPNWLVSNSKVTYSKQDGIVTIRTSGLGYGMTSVNVAAQRPE